MGRIVAALYVLADGPYSGLEDVEPWPLERDARKYAGPHPVVAHPPCARWGRYWSGGPSAKLRRELGDDGRFGIPTPPKAGGWHRCIDATTLPTPDLTIRVYLSRPVAAARFASSSFASPSGGSRSCMSNRLARGQRRVASRSRVVSVGSVGRPLLLTPERAERRDVTLRRVP